MSIHPAMINFFNFGHDQDDKEKEVIFPISLDQFYLRL